jgi:Flp pilus assembly protein TadG
MNSLVRLRNLCKAKDGAALVEFALVAPVMLLLLLGTIDLGRGYYMGLEMANAAHAGAEYGSQNPSNTAGITAAAKQSAPNLSSLTVATPTWGCECSDGTSYTANCATTPTCTANASRGSNVVRRIQVQTSVVYTTLVPWPGIPSQLTLSNTATLRGN